MKGEDNIIGLVGICTGFVSCLQILGVRERREHLALNIYNRIITLASSISPSLFSCTRLGRDVCDNQIY